MSEIEKTLKGVIAGIFVVIAILAIAPPLFEALANLAKQLAFPVSLVFGLLLFGLAITIFERAIRGRH